MVALEAETNPNIMARDDLLFKNLDAIENTLTVASFAHDGVNGDWFVSEDDYYSSDSKYK